MQLPNVYITFKSILFEVFERTGEVMYKSFKDRTSSVHRILSDSSDRQCNDETPSLRKAL